MFLIEAFLSFFGENNNCATVALNGHANFH